MSKIAIVRTDFPLPDLAAAGQLLFKALDGLSADDRKAWRRFWSRVKNLEACEIRQICNMRTRDERADYLSGIEKKRGKAAADIVRQKVAKEWELRRKNT